MANERILVVDDEEDILKLVEYNLARGGCRVTCVTSGEQALQAARESRPDLVLLDAAMPGLDGHAVCRVLKKDPETRAIPVLMMSGVRIEDKDVVSGLGGGADDYIAKPFSMPVLLARIQAVLRRYQAPTRMKGRLKRCGIELDPAGRTVKAGGRPVSLTRKEFDLLAVLISKPGRALSVPYLLETVWGYDPAVYNDPGTVEVHVSRLRRKLGPGIAKRIASVLGHGYKFEE